MNNNLYKKFKVMKRIYILAIVLYVCLFCTNTMAFAAEEDPLKVINNLSDFIFNILKAVGVLLAGLGVMQIVS